MKKQRVRRVQEIDMQDRVCSGQTRNVPAYSRKEAKEQYIAKGYKRFPGTRLTAIVIGEMSEWAGE